MGRGFCAAAWLSPSTLHDTLGYRDTCCTFAIEFPAAIRGQEGMTMMTRLLRVGDVFRLLPRPNGAQPADVEHRLAMTWLVTMVRFDGQVTAVNTDTRDRTQMIEFHQGNDWIGWTPEYVELIGEVES